MASKKVMARVRKTQKERSDRAKRMDASRDSKRTYDEPTDAQAEAWIRDPSRSDIRGIDTKPTSKPKGKGKANTPAKPEPVAPKTQKKATGTSPAPPKGRKAPTKGKGAPKPKVTPKPKTKSKSEPKTTRRILKRTVEVRDAPEEVTDYSEEYEAYYAAMDSVDGPVDSAPVRVYEPDDFEEIDRKKERLGRKKRERRTPVGEYSESYYRKLLGKGDDPAAYSAIGYAMMGEGEPIEGALEYLMDSGYEDEAENSRWKWDSRETNSAFLRKKAQEIREQEMYYAGLSGNTRAKRPKGPGYFREVQSDGTVRIPLEILFAPVRVMCGGRAYDYKTRKEAIDVFREAVAECDGAERDRYQRIFDMLMFTNLDRVSDGVPVRIGGRRG